MIAILATALIVLILVVTDADGPASAVHDRMVASGDIADAYRESATTEEPRSSVPIAENGGRSGLEASELSSRWTPELSELHVTVLSADGTACPDAHVSVTGIHAVGGSPLARATTDQSGYTRIMIWGARRQELMYVRARREDQMTDATLCAVGDHVVIRCSKARKWTLEWDRNLRAGTAIVIPRAENGLPGMLHEVILGVSGTQLDFLGRDNGYYAFLLGDGIGGCAEVRDDLTTIQLEPRRGHRVVGECGTEVSSSALVIGGHRIPATTGQLRLPQMPAWSHVLVGVEVDGMVWRPSRWGTDGAGAFCELPVWYKGKRTLLFTCTDDMASPVEGAELFRGSSGGNIGRPTAWTRSDGTAEIAWYPRDRAGRLRMEGDSSETYLVLASGFHPELVTVAQGQEQIDVRLRHCLATTVKVLDSQGKGVTNALISYFSPLGRGSVTATADELGVFSAEIPEGWKVIASRSGTTQFAESVAPEQGSTLSLHLPASSTEAPSLNVKLVGGQPPYRVWSRTSGGTWTEESTDSQDILEICRTGTRSEIWVRDTRDDVGHWAGWVQSDMKIITIEIHAALPVRLVLGSHEVMPQSSVRVSVGNRDLPAQWLSCSPLVVPVDARRLGERWEANFGAKVRAQGWAREDAGVHWVDLVGTRQGSVRVLCGTHLHGHQTGVVWIHRARGSEALPGEKHWDPELRNVRFDENGATVLSDLLPGRYAIVVAAGGPDAGAAGWNQSVVVAADAETTVALVEKPVWHCEVKGIPTDAVLVPLDADGWLGRTDLLKVGREGASRGGRVMVPVWEGRFRVELRGETVKEVRIVAGQTELL